MIYLDNNATTLIDPRVAEHMAELHRARLANPSSHHAAGHRARQILEHSREQLLDACGGRMQGMASDQLVFTSGGTESNNLALLGFAARRPGCVVVSRIEHSSVLGAAQYLETRGRSVRYLPCSASGVVDVDVLRQWIDEDPTGIACVSVMFANNETGVLQPVQAIGELCRVAGVPFHTDAVQGFCKVPLRFQDLAADAMTVTSHKLHGPLGIGALVLRHGSMIEPHHYGGAQQLGLRPGTEMPVLASGFANAVGLAQAELHERAQRMQSLRERLERGVCHVAPVARILAQDSHRLPHTSCIAFLGLDRQAIQIALDHRGVACRSGSACASGSSQPSHVLQAMHLTEDAVGGAIRFSLSFETTEREIDDTIAAVKQVIDRMTMRPSSS
ncbi:MAG: cysteine desulfurase family protein [Planctomycetota bacterium]